MTSTTASPSFTVAIIGAGIAGITLAIALSKQNPSLKLTIYESRHEFSQISAGVGVFLFLSSLSIYPQVLTGLPSLPKVRLSTSSSFAPLFHLHFNLLSL